MLPAHNRLTKIQEFQSVLKKGKSGWGNYVTIKYQFIGPDEKTKIGFIVSTKISKLATRRNKIKRLLRENFRREFLPIFKKPFWVVVIAKRGIVDKNYQDIKKDLAYILKKQHLI